MGSGTTPRRATAGPLLCAAVLAVLLGAAPTPASAQSPQARPATDAASFLTRGQRTLARRGTVRVRVRAARSLPGLEPGRPRYRDRPYPDRPPPAPFFGLPSLGGPGYSTAGSGLVFWDIGPVRPADGGTAGTPPPPAGNVPPREGQDPHEAPRRSAAAQAQKSAFLRPPAQSRVVDVCGGPCYAGGYTGAGAP